MRQPPASSIAMHRASPTALPAIASRTAQRGTRVRDSERNLAILVFFKGNAICDTGVVNSYLRRGVASKPLICDTAPRLRHIPQIDSAPPGMRWHGAGPSSKLSHGQNGPALEEIFGILVHTRETFRTMSQTSLIRVRHRCR